eukprot:1082007-Prymnesium_polylepis.1
MRMSARAVSARQTSAHRASGPACTRSTPHVLAPRHPHARASASPLPGCQRPRPPSRAARLSPAQVRAAARPSRSQQPLSSHAAPGYQLRSRL